MRLIDADALIHAIEDIKLYNVTPGQKPFDMNRVRVDELIEIVNQLAEKYINCSTDTSTNISIGWIPTSERLPEKNAIVLVCDKDGWISVKVNMPYAGVKNDFECGYYVAWMPLPEPFTPKEGRE